MVVNPISGPAEATATGDGARGRARGGASGVARPRLLVVAASMVAASMVAAMVVAGCGGSEQELPHAEKGEVLEIDSATGRAFLDSDERVLLLEVRTVDEYMKGHVVGAQIADLSDRDRWDFRLSELDRDTPVMVYCRDSECSAEASSMLVDEGFVEVYDLGYPGMWDPAYLPIDKRGR